MLLPPLPSRVTPYAFDLSLGLAEFEAAIATEEVEVAAAFDAQGRFVLRPRAGGRKQVGFHPSEAHLLQDAAVTHNHPDASAFSDADALLASENDLAELRIVQPTGVVYVLRPERGWPDPETMVEAALEPLDALRIELRRRIMNPRERSGFVLDRQRDAFGQIGVEMRRTSVWR